MPNYNFVIDGNIARGVLHDGTSFLIDADMIEEVNKYAFHLNWKGYIYYLAPKGKENIRLHWLVLGFKNRPNVIIDHINRDKTDCRRENLRITDNQHNSCNRKLSSNNSVGYRGVFFCKQKQMYKSTIGFNYRRIVLWLSEDAVECAQAYNLAARLLFKEYAGYQNEVPETKNMFMKEYVIGKCIPYIDMDFSMDKNGVKIYG